MKVICFTVSLSSGGAEHQLIILAELLREKGYDVDVVTFSDVEDHYLTPQGVNRITLGKGLSKKKKIWAIYKYFMSLRDSIVISYGQRANMTCLVPLMINWRPRIIAGERNVTIRDSFMNTFLINILYRRVNWIVPNNKTQFDYLCNKRRYLGKKTRVIYNYTDINSFNYDASHQPIGNNIVVFGRYHSQKNTVRFVEAVRLLKERIGDSFHFDWYGNYMMNVKEQEPAYVEMEQLVKKYNLCDVLSLHDKTAEVARIMHDSDAVCLPSIYEGFSNTLSEAICCGKVCLAGRVSDNPTMVENGINGFLFDPYNVADMVNSFIQFINTSIKDRVNMQEQSRRKALELFDKERFVNSYMDLIKS